ncbi:hypothetical protein ACVWZZ_002739 [Bradyrhizobium sp. LM6.10]
MALQQRLAAIDAARADPGRDILLEALVEGVALAPVEEASTAPSWATPLSAALVTPAETPAPCASAVMLATKLLKSPPQRAAWADPLARQAMKAMAKAGLDIRENPLKNERESGTRSCPGTGFASKRQTSPEPVASWLRQMKCARHFCASTGRRAGQRAFYIVHITLAALQQRDR